MTTTDDLTIRLDRTLGAAPGTVFAAITTPELVRRWMGPQGSTCHVEEMQVVLGGRLALRVSFPDGPSFLLTGFYEDIQPGRRLVHSWGMADEDVTSTVVWDLEPIGTGTHLTLRHLGLTRPEEVEQNGPGWAHLLDRLEAVLAD